MAWDPIKSSGWMLGILASLPFHLSDETPSLFIYDCESCSAVAYGAGVCCVVLDVFFFNLEKWIGLRENFNRKTRYFMGKSMVSSQDFPLNQSIQIWVCLKSG
jgi:hypothetical protein